MAIEEFWSNLRTAVGLFASTGAVDLAKEKPDREERFQRIGDGWLTERTVDGFDPNEFRFLDEEQQAALTKSVERFRAAAREVRADKPATQLQTEEGRGALEEILHILQPHKFRDAESFWTQVVLERELQALLPAWVTGICCECGVDSVGGAAVWIWIDVKDRAVEKRLIEKEGQALHEVIEDAYRRTGGRRWPYIRFRSPDAFARKKEPA